MNFKEKVSFYLNESNSLRKKITKGYERYPYGSFKSHEKNEKEIHNELKNKNFRVIKINEVPRFAQGDKYFRNAMLKYFTDTTFKTLNPKFIGKIKYFYYSKSRKELSTNLSDA